jgi:hypothetical protein
MNTIGRSFDAGMDGVLLWDSSKNFISRAHCESLLDYLDSSLGPFVKAVTNFAEKCSVVLCKGNGKCVRKSWIERSGLQNLILFKVFDFKNYKCRCLRGWKGTHCDEPTSTSLNHLHRS